MEYFESSKITKSCPSTQGLVVIFFFHFDAETKELEQDLLKFLQQKGKTPYAWQEALLSTAAVSW